MTSKSAVPPISDEPSETPSPTADFLNRPEFEPAAKAAKTRRVFLLLVPLSLLALIAAASYGGYRYYLTQHATKTSTVSAPTQAKATDPYAGWMTYTSGADHFSFKYPPTWTLDTQHAPTREVGYDSIMLVSPSKTVLYAYADTGGRGGECVPAPRDVPFQKGNHCPTLEYLTAEKLPIDNVYYDAEVPNPSTVKFVPKPASIYLVTTHYADQNGVSSYGITTAEVPKYGVTVTGSTTPQDGPTLNTPQMGYVFPYMSLTINNAQGQLLPLVYIHADGRTSSFLTSTDATTIKSIIRTLRLNI